MPKSAQNGVLPKKKQRLPVGEVKERARHLSEEFLACRDTGHGWHQYRLIRVRGGYERSLYCKSCKTAKHQFISRSGEILAVNYTYQDGYQMQGVGRLYGDHRAVLRLEALERQVEAAERQHLIQEDEEGNEVIGAPASSRV